MTNQGNVISNLPDTASTNSMTFELQGEAYQVVLRLRNIMRNVKSESDVIANALALLNRAKGKEIQIIDPKTGDVEIVNLWK